MATEFLGSGQYVPEDRECGEKPGAFFAKMADIVDTQTRSRMMSEIGHENTGPEMILQREFKSRGYEFDTHRRDLPGNPDLIFPEFRAVIQVHGCFWHHHDCALLKWPKTRERFWKDKLGRNEIRDGHNLHLLKVASWRAFIIWECAVKRRPDSEVGRVIDYASQWLESRSEYFEIAEALYRDDWPTATRSGAAFRSAVRRAPGILVAAERPSKVVDALRESCVN